MKVMTMVYTGQSDPTTAFRGTYVPGGVYALVPPRRIYRTERR
jgi:hypothetical protein